MAFVLYKYLTLCQESMYIKQTHRSKITGEKQFFKYYKILAKYTVKIPHSPPTPNPSLNVSEAHKQP